MYCNTDSCLNMISKVKSNKDKIQIWQWPHPYKARDIQNKPLEVKGYAEYFLINDNNFVRRVDIIVVKQGDDNDVIINMDTLKKMGVVEENFLKINVSAPAEQLSI